MIARDEVDHVAGELGVHTTNVQRDYVFGWVLAALYNETKLAQVLHLKGGNCLRKAYLPKSRFSPDLDFGAEHALDPRVVEEALARVCDVAGDRAGVTFFKDRTRIQEKQRVHSELSVYEARLYFRDFYGAHSKVDISVRLDMTEYDSLHLGTVERPLYHAYSDAESCKAALRCARLEEVLASKVKCLLQRRHVADLYDLVHWILFSSEPMNRADVARVFLRKTIYGPAPAVAGELLRALPFPSLVESWERFIVCAKDVVVRFEKAVDTFLGLVNELFGQHRGYSSLSFFPAHLRTPILEAGAKSALLRIRYNGVVREVEPYSLQFKKRKDGGGGEYLYVYDRTGGSKSAPGVKTLVAEKIEALTVTTDSFEPRFPVELSKAGDPVADPSFARSSLPSVFRIGRTSRRGPLHRYKCCWCGRHFGRKSLDSTLKPHKGRDGWPCGGRIGEYLGCR